jgi:rare lipoprotein A
MVCGGYPKGSFGFGLARRVPRVKVVAMIRPQTAIALALMLGLALSLSPALAFGPKRYHEGETEKGDASWYGADFQGKTTANGETFDKNQMTAAHRHLPFNTIVKVTNLSNGISVEVRINDRGPYEGGRIIDVSEAAADILQMKKAGVIPVEIEVIQLGPPGRHNN